MAKPEPKRQNAAGPTIKIPEGVSEFYANSLNVLLTPWDFVLLWGSLALPATVPRQPTAVGEIRVDAAIRMSPQHAKAAAIVMQRMVAAFEQEFGEIPVTLEETLDETEQKQLDSGSGSTSG